MKSDFQISNECEKKHIAEVAGKLGIKEEDLILYGNHKAKIQTKNIKKDINDDAKLVLVTSINPTSSGEGKSTVTIGLSDGLNRIGKKSCVALREPSLGPVLGRKGGAAGGGYAQVVPMEDINLHFTGDMHAITTAHNAIAVLVNNHVFQGNELEIDKIVFNRVMDMNARDLRHIKVNAGTDLERLDGFDITVASEVMAILCLSEGIADLKEKLSNILVAYNKKGEPVYLKDLKIEGVITSLLKDAIKPNIVQTLENNPAIIHGGPFANIAHGCNSILATKTALKFADYVITEAGFGADLGAEKFLNIKCRKAGLKPKAAVVVATVKALKLHGDIEEKDLKEENLEALAKGVQNLEKHIENLRKFNLPIVVALNVFVTDTEKELAFLENWAKEQGVEFSRTEVWEKGGLGGVDLAEKVVKAVEGNDKELQLLYKDEASITEKIETVCREIYGADGVNFSDEAKAEIERIESLGFKHLPVCMAKTPASLTDNAKIKGRPTGFNITINDVKLRSGAGFVVAYANKVLTMPGLPKVPSALNIDIDEETETIVGIF
ncbi:formate--tetrahydrofolate ligase [Gemella haemolysans]|uniref:Formate--tetrahydrofolate ligase n=1 Tax=Gemella haemolysans ATCC 10379 TaxID=546270 RepID=C5NYX8_9BACL|nr:formate--tetrahydrofolate ligase [Gemella haemolysans]EER67765.1 formate--tetrahydrofolate ligase [Gemella haemolysans ATCC 10379]KAA8709467.1 formate--tetrahydrofolate ligase [Gemella haemolysans]UBH83166.1 formate--tetrahydrofolate ligase [Gemella haemolysans]VEI38556.1 Formate--tetrahydrofolate ligase [Gemella haemolysans]